MVAHPMQQVRIRRDDKEETLFILAHLAQVFPGHLLMAVTGHDTGPGVGVTLTGLG